MDQKTTLHINIDAELKHKFKLLCFIDGWTIQNRIINLVKEYIQHNEYKIKNLDK
jgi:hypothetical protein